MPADLEREIMSEKDGGPAFPSAQPTDWDGDPIVTDSGMTLRDYFAVHAMQALAVETLKATKINTQILARNAYVIADAMLQEREQ